jgi:2-oxo-hept-3-ene-1,7-dioate hydratase
VLGKPLKGPGVSLFDVLSATEYVTPAVEIIDARIEQFDRETKAMRKVYDTISDFAANAGIVTGGRPVRPTDVDLRWVGALLHKNGVIEETGLAAGCSATRRPAWRGWPTRSHRTTSSSTPATSC